MRVPFITLVLVAIVLLISGCGTSEQWTQADKEKLRALALTSLPPLRPDPSNKHADDVRAAQFGHELFFDTRFSANGQVACATCHLPNQEFQDGKPLANGVGTTTRRTMTIVGTAYSPWLFWDGRKDSQWAQALGPMENPVEHGGNRTQYAHLIEQLYRTEYEALFGTMPDLSQLPASAGPVPDTRAREAWDAMTPQQRDTVNRIYANMGKAIAAYERKIMPGVSRFDKYVEAILKNDAAAAQALLTADEVAGLHLFIGKANCTNCHNGALFTNNDFHNTGVPAVPTLPEDKGRAVGAVQVLADEFNCLGAYSDAKPEQCAELRYIKVDAHEMERQFKPPSLRGVAERAPYMHAGQFKTLQEVLNHYNTAPSAPAGHSELKPLNLSEQELGQISAFLKTLSAPLSTAPEWLQQPVLPSATSK